MQKVGAMNPTVLHSPTTPKRAFTPVTPPKKFTPVPIPTTSTPTLQPSPLKKPFKPVTPPSANIQKKFSLPTSYRPPTSSLAGKPNQLTTTTTNKSSNNNHIIPGATFSPPQPSRKFAPVTPPKKFTTSVPSTTITNNNTTTGVPLPSTQNNNNLVLRSITNKVNTTTISFAPVQKSVPSVQEKEVPEESIVVTSKPVIGKESLETEIETEAILPTTEIVTLPQTPIISSHEPDQIREEKVETQVITVVPTEMTNTTATDTILEASTPIVSRRDRKKRRRSAKRPSLTPSQQLTTTDTPDAKKTCLNETPPISREEILIKTPEELQIERDLMLDSPIATPPSNDIVIPVIETGKLAFNLLSYASPNPFSPYRRRVLGCESLVDRSVKLFDADSDESFADLEDDEEEKMNSMAATEEFLKMETKELQEEYKLYTTEVIYKPPPKPATPTPINTPRDVTRSNRNTARASPMVEQVSAEKILDILPARNSSTPVTASSPSPVRSVVNRRFKKKKKNRIVDSDDEEEVAADKENDYYNIMHLSQPTDQPTSSCSTEQPQQHSQDSMSSADGLSRNTRNSIR